MIQIIPNLHPLVVHFPIALIGASLMFHLAATLKSKHRLAKEWVAVARWTLWLAALSAIPSALLGWLAFNSVEHDDAGHAAMLIHRQFALFTMLVSVGMAGIAFYTRKKNTIPMWQTLLMAGLFVLISMTAWLGGEVVYRHGIGVLALPEKESSEIPSALSRELTPAVQNQVNQAASGVQEAAQAQPEAHSDGHHHHHTH